MNWRSIIIFITAVSFLRCESEKIRYYRSLDKKQTITRLDRDDSTFFMYGQFSKKTQPYIAVQNVVIRGGWEAIVEWKNRKVYFYQPYDYFFSSDTSSNNHLKIIQIADTNFYKTYYTKSGLLKFDQNN